MKHFCLFILLIITSLHLFAQKDSYIISGSIDEAFEGQAAMLFRFKGGQISSVDTTIIKKNKFKFQGKEYTEEFSFITIGNYPDKVINVELILERGKIKLDIFGLRKRINTDKPQYMSSISGTPLNAAYQNFKKETGYKSAMNYEKILELIKRNSSNILGKKMFDDVYLYIPDDMRQRFLSNMDKNFLNDPQIKLCLMDINYLDQLTDTLKSIERWEGTIFQDFESYLPSGERKMFYDYTGKIDYLLLVFWATWSEESEAFMNKKLRDLHTKYNPNGLEIVMVSLDRGDDYGKAAWQTTVGKNDYPWVQLSELKGLSSDLAMRYSISNLPYMFLLDRQNKIIKCFDLLDDSYLEYFGNLFRK